MEHIPSTKISFAYKMRAFCPFPHSRQKNHIDLFIYLFIKFIFTSGIIHILAWNISYDLLTSWISSQHVLLGNHDFPRNNLCLDYYFIINIILCPFNVIYQLLKRNIILLKSDDIAFYVKEQRKWSILRVCNCPYGRKLIYKVSSEYSYLDTSIYR